MTAPEQPGGAFGRAMRTEARQASLYTLTTFVTQFGSFLVVPLFWRKLSLADYGVIGLTEMIATFLALFIGLSLDTSITRFYYEWPEGERKRRVGTLWVLNWVACAGLGLLAMLVLAPASAALFPDVAYYPYIFFGLVLTILRAMFAVPYATIRIVNSPRLYAGYTLGGFAIQLSLNVVYVLLLDRGLHGYFVSSIIGHAITAALGGAIMLRFAEPCVERGGLRESMRFSLPSIPTSMLSAVTQVTDRFLLQRFAPIEALGVYSVALKFTNLVLYLHNALKLSYVPYMVKAVARDPAAGIANLVRARPLYLVPLLVGATCIGVFIDSFVNLTGQVEYAPVARWVPWFIGPVAISTLTVYYAPGLFLAKRTDLTWIPQVVQLAVVVASGLVLIPVFELAGVVASRYLSTVVLFGVTLALSQRVYPIGIRWSQVAGMLLVTGVATALGSRLDLGSEWANIPARAGVVAAAVLALAVLAAGSVASLRAGMRTLLGAGTIVPSAGGHVQTVPPSNVRS